MTTDDIDEIDDPVEDEAILEEGPVLDALEPTPEDLAAATAAPEPGLGEVESIQDILAKQETREAEEAAEEEEEAAALATLAKDERLEPVDSRVVPMQATEFMCKRCFLVKHRSQLADKKKTLCRDCA